MPSGQFVLRASSSLVVGDWVQIQLPNAVTAKGYQISNSQYAVGSWTLAGSTNGTTWTLLDSQGAVTNSSGAYVSGTALSTTAVPIGALTSFTFTNSTSYTYYRFICRTSSSATAAFVGLNQLYILA